MAYQITYGPKTRAEKLQPKRRGWMVAAAVVLAVILYAAVAWGSLKNWLLPGDAAVTENALETFVQQLGEGESLTDAFACFCREIIGHAQAD